MSNTKFVRIMVAMLCMGVDISYMVLAVAGVHNRLSDYPITSILVGSVTIAVPVAYMMMVDSPCPRR